MAGRVKLQDLYVRFTTEGLKESEQQTEKTAKKVETTWGKMSTAVSRQLRNTFTGLAALATPFASLWALSKSGASGTREADNLSAAYQYAAQVISTMFAPAMRFVTTLLVRAGDAIMNLSPQTKQWVVGITLVTTGLVAAAGAAILFTTILGGLGTVAAIAWAVVTSPVTLVIAAIAGLTLAFASLFGYMSEGSVTASGDLDKANKSWIGHAIDGLGWLADKFAQFFNWTMRQAAEASDFIAWALSSAGEELGILEKGTTAVLNSMEKIKPFQIDRSGLGNFFNDLSQGAEKNIPTFSELLKYATGIGSAVRDIPALLSKLTNPAGMKLNAKMTVSFESLQDSFDRLQSAFASGTQSDKLEQIRKEGEETNEILNRILGKIVPPGAIVGP